MKGKIFVDTNILIYLFSETEPEKLQISQHVFRKYYQGGQLIWSTQVVQEFCHNLLHKRGQDQSSIKKSLSLFSSMELIINDLDTIQRAIDIRGRNKISFWDSLILSSAVSAKCSYLLSEDMQHGQKIEGVEIVNPFLI